MNVVDKAVVERLISRVFDSEYAKERVLHAVVVAVLANLTPADVPAKVRDAIKAER